MVRPYCKHPDGCGRVIEELIDISSSMVQVVFRPRPLRKGGVLDSRYVWWNKSFLRVSVFAFFSAEEAHFSNKSGIKKRSNVITDINFVVVNK